jgi:hypothetical protein
MRISIFMAHKIETVKSIIKIADSYIEHKVIPLRYRYDAVHISIVTVNKIKKIISLNFKHIVRDKTRAFTQYINIVYRLSSINIKSPINVIMAVIDNEYSQYK